MRIVLWLWTVTILWLVPAARADDAWLIVPGKSVGKIALGMNQVDVFKLLGTPNMQNDFETTDRHAVRLGQGEKGDVPVPEGVTQSDWTTTIPLTDKVGNRPEYLCDFVTVYIRQAKVVQIEIRAPRFHTTDGLTTRDTGEKWRKTFSQTEVFRCKYAHPSAGGIPATKHFMAYEDAVKDGVGWRCAGFGNLSPEVDPDDVLDTLIIHAPGEKLIPDPDGGSRFIWKDWPYRTPAGQVE